jgi:hypothetical protein
MATKTKEVGKEKRGLAGAVRAMAMARKMAIASNNDDNHIIGNDSNNSNDHNDNGVKDSSNNDDAHNGNEDKGNENGDGNEDNDKDNNNNEQ